MKLEELTLPESNSGYGAVPVGSNSRCMRLSDALRLAKARSSETPLSFGSTLHLNFGATQACRPCLFERWPGRCIKSWLCDFCHLHTNDRRKKAKRSIVACKTLATRRSPKEALHLLPPQYM
mmetsp:Transcript_76402/g.177322  ORF Transcript_76402/g.177322 Transcript_76402/m.177322 type:complete len:122 (-) Transcript_76402:91-456(-)